jgi:hypothetical protein
VACAVCLVCVVCCACCACWMRSALGVACCMLCVACRVIDLSLLLRWASQSNEVRPESYREFAMNRFPFYQISVISLEQAQRRQFFSSCERIVERTN